MSHDQPSQSERPVEDVRARHALLNMSDSELAELHGQGPDGLKPGAWDIVDQEVRRRARVEARQGFGARVTKDHHDEERYPALRAIVFLTKAIALVTLLISVVSAIWSFSQTRTAGVAGPLAGFVFLVGGIIVSITYWASAEILVLLMDIEHNTRSVHRE
jgi:hypothetical protein